jgi:hypothetical protein
VLILCDLYQRRLLNNPRLHKVIDLRTIAPLSTYPSSTKTKLLKAEATVEIQAAEIEDMKQRLEFYEEYTDANS